jgi:hypothetical protein
MPVAPREVVVLAEHVMARLDTAMNRIDDSNGYLGSATWRLLDLHHAACLAGPVDARRLGTRLVEFELKTNWEWFLGAPERYADVLGDDGLASYRARLEREWDMLPQLQPKPGRPFVTSYGGRRATITLLRVSLARAGGSVDELVAVLARGLSSPFCFCRIADELDKAGRERKALAWLERGVAAFPPAGDPQLRSRAIGAYLRAARTTMRSHWPIARSTPSPQRTPTGSFARQARTSSGTRDARDRSCSLTRTVRRWSLESCSRLACSSWSGGRVPSGARSSASRTAPPPQADQHAQQPGVVAGLNPGDAHQRAE